MNTYSLIDIKEFNKNETEYYKIINFYKKNEYFIFCLRNIYNFKIVKVKIKNYYFKIIDVNQIKYYKEVNTYNLGETEFDIFTTTIPNVTYKEKLVLIYSNKESDIKKQTAGPEYYNTIPNDVFYLTSFRFDMYLKFNCKYSENSILDFTDISFVDIKDYVYKISLIAFDIEVVCSNAFPKNGDNAISHICYDIQFNDNKKKRVITINADLFEEKVKVVDCQYIINEITNSDVSFFVFYQTEKNVIKSFESLINLEFDFILTYNGDNFDFDYLQKRADRLNLDLYFVDSYNIKKELYIYFNKYISVNQLSNKLFSNNIDLYKYCKNSINSLKDNKLDTISNDLLNSKFELKKQEDSYFVIELKNPTKSFMDIINTTYISEIKINENVYTIKKVTNKDIELYGNYDKSENVCYIGKMSVDLPYEYANYSKESADFIGKYCLLDALLCTFIFNILSVSEKFFSYLSICKNYPKDYLTKKSTRNILNILFNISLLNKKAYYTRNQTIENKYKGAIVVEPKNKISKSIIGIFDYASLYPSSIKGGNFSPETLLYEKQIPKKIYYEKIYNIKEKYKFPDYIIICLPNEYDVDDYDDNITVRVFDRKKKGIIPLILDYYINERKVVKGKITNLDKNAPNYLDMYRYYDALQYQLKISANSVYGLVSREYFSLQSYAVGECCTSLSRQLEMFIINLIKNLTLDFKNNKLILSDKNKQNTIYYPNTKIQLSSEDRDINPKNIKNFSSVTFDIIYGDSVTEDTPIIIKTIYDNIIFTRICNICNNNFIQDGKKEISYPKNIYAWTASGWCKILKIIRHKTKKKIYRIKTLNSVVDVTEDHSLLSNKLKEIKPSDLKINKTELFHNHYLENKNRRLYKYEQFETGLNKLELARKYFMLSNELYNLEIIEEESNLFGIRSSAIKDNFVKNVRCIRKNTNEYVYDIETEDGTFNCGFPLIVKNTDSVFVKINRYISSEKDSPEEIHSIYNILCFFINDILSHVYPTHKMEYEGYVKNFILKSKKKYMGEKYSDGNNFPKFYTKGMSIIRKETIQIHKDIVMGCYDIFKKEDINYQDKIINFVCTTLKNEISKNDKNKFKNYVKNAIYNKNKQSLVKNAFEEYCEDDDEDDLDSKDGSRFYFIYAINDTFEYNEKFFKSKKKSDYIHIVDKNKNNEFVFPENIRPIYEFYFPNIINEISELYDINSTKFIY